MRDETVKLGGLRTRVVDMLPAGAKPGLAVVLCHGFGAPATDLVPLGAELLESSDRLQANARFYFPGGPLDLSAWGMYGAAAWWMVDFEAIQRALAEGTFRNRVRNDRPEGLVEARAALLRLIDEVRAETGLGLDRVAIGGFSQGAMLGVDVALQLPQNVAALIAWSGTLLNEDEWRRLAPAHRGLRVVQSHGRQDPILPYAWAEYLRDLLLEFGLQVDFLPFAGPHTISLPALERARQVLEQACP
ncbi:MAG: phospholipase [Planctomycetes bacterium]|jgi:phospholipase/carboxylesterase|nr:phospholipase [Planctomycetota bacterium]MCL4729318.1 phospholipase [Planctomycetota bacterium]